MMTYLSRMSLRFQISLLVSALLAGVALFLLWFFPQRMNAHARHWIEGRSLGVASVLANAITPGVDFDDAPAVSNLLGTLRTTPDAIYARVQTADGKTFASWGDSAVTIPRGPEVGDTFLEDDVIHVRRPIVVRSGRGATLLVGFSLSEVAKESREYMAVVSLVAAGVFILGLLASLAIGNVLVRPMRRLTEVAQQIVGGDLVGAENVLGGRVEVERMSSTIEDGAPSRNEMKQLLGAFARMLSSLRGLSSTLHASADVLTESVQNLTSSAGEQSQNISKQAAALQETQVTAQEIKQTSVLAAQKAEAVVQVAERADLVSRSGEAAIEQSLEGLSDIRSRVEAIASKIGELSDRARQIGSITQTVKDLADQSNMLALNAAIEAVRSGEHGKGFAVVAREIRSLADQSIQATNRVREILEDIGNAVRVAVAITEEGSERIEAGLGQVRSSGENIRELSAIVKDNAAAVRQIAAAVSQQNIGFTQIFTAVTDLSSMMDDTVRRIESTHHAVTSLKDVSERVSDVANHYRL